MRPRLLLAALLLFLLLGTPARAAEDTYYIFQAKTALEEPALSRAEPLHQASGIYRTNELSLIEELDAAGLLLYWAPDAEVQLFDLAEDAQALLSEDWSRAMLGVGHAFDRGIYGSGVRVGMIDSGIRADFGELTGAAVIQGVNYLAGADSEERGDTSDSVGHGTFVASVIASDAVGIAPGAELVPLKCFDAKTSSVSCIVSAVYDAVDVYHCDVLNLSLGMASDNQALRQAIAYAHESGVIIVAASGNLSGAASTGGNDKLYYPAAYDGVIGVGAVDRAKGIGSFSVQNESVWVTAPGAAVSGLALEGTEYKSGSGTSYAAPFVAAAAALALEADPDMTPARFMDLLAASSEDLGDEGYDKTYGNGLLNVGLLLATAQEDSQSLILSAWGGSICVSAWYPDTGSAFQLLLARYNSSGRFIEARFLTNGAGAPLLNNQALPEDLTPFAIFVVEQGSYIPITAARRYL